MTNDREHINPEKTQLGKKIPQAQEAQSMQSRQQAGWQQHPLTLNHINQRGQNCFTGFDTEKEGRGEEGPGRLRVGGRKGEEKEDKKRLSQ